MFFGPALVSSVTIADTHGESVIQETLKHFEPPGAIGIKDVPGGQLFMEGLWLCGYLPHPDMAFVGLTPNAAAMLRVLALGEVDSIVIDIATLISVSSDIVGPPFENMEYLSANVAQWDVEKLTEMYANGVKMYRLRQRKGELAFIPQGYLVVEQTAAPHTMIYGMRKSFFVKNTAAKESYKQLIKIYVASGRNTDRMALLLEKMEQD